MVTLWFEQNKKLSSQSHPYDSASDVLRVISHCSGSIFFFVPTI